MSDVERKHLGRKTVTGGFATGLTHVTLAALNLCGLFILARFVRPSDFGLIAKVAAATSILSIVGDMGLSVATIQSFRLNPEQRSALFWVNVAIASLVSIIMALSAPLISAFYGDARAAPVTYVFALNVMLVGFGAQHTAILKRELRFPSIAIVNVIAATIGLLTATIAAVVFNMGYWSLLLQTVMSSASNTLGYWISSRWFPRFNLEFSSIRRHMRVGGNFTIASFINHLARTGDDVLIGKYCGEQTLGYYSKAYELLLMPMRKLMAPMSQVAVPALSRLQSHPEEYRNFFRKGISIAMVLQLPIVCFAAMSGGDIILTILGPAWRPSIPLFHALVPNLLASSTAPATQWVFVSTGSTDRLVKMVTVNSLCVFIAFVFGLQYGAVGVAWAFSITTCLTRVPSILYCFHGTPLRAHDFFPLMLAPGLCSVLAATVSFVLTISLASYPPPARLLIQFTSFAITYIFCVSFTAAGREVGRQAQWFARSTASQILCKIKMETA